MKLQFALPVAVVVLAVLWWVGANSSASTAVSATGLHAHPTIEIYVKGEKIEIPQNIGVGPTFRGKPGYGQGNMAMTPIHTHDDVPVIHLEFTEKVTDDDLALGNLFAIWGRDMRSFGTNMRMTVNGVENTEFEDYHMRDKDEITLYFD